MPPTTIQYGYGPNSTTYTDITAALTKLAQANPNFIIPAGDGNRAAILGFDPYPGQLKVIIKFITINNINNYEIFNDTVPVDLTDFINQVAPTSGSAGVGLSFNIGLNNIEDILNQVKQGILNNGADLPYVPDESIGSGDNVDFDISFNIGITNVYEIIKDVIQIFSGGIGYSDLALPLKYPGLVNSIETFISTDPAYITYTALQKISLIASTMNVLTLVYIDDDKSPLLNNLNGTDTALKATALRNAVAIALLTNPIIPTNPLIPDPSLPTKTADITKDMLLNYPLFVSALNNIEKYVNDNYGNIISDTAKEALSKKIIDTLINLNWKTGSTGVGSELASATSSISVAAIQKLLNIVNGTTVFAEANFTNYGVTKTAILKFVDDKYKSILPAAQIAKLNTILVSVLQIWYLLESKSYIAASLESTTATTQQTAIDGFVKSAGVAYSN